MDDEEGVFGYVFIDAAVPGRNVRGLVDKLSRVNRPDVRVRFASDVAGAYEGFAVVQARELKHLQDFLQEQELWADQKKTYIEKRGGPVPAKRDGCEMLAIVRIQTRRGAAQTVYDALLKLVEADKAEHGGDRHYHGVSMVFGSFDILLTLNAADMDTLTDLALGIQGLTDDHGPLRIVRTETSFADCRHLEARRSQPPS